MNYYNDEQARPMCWHTWQQQAATPAAVPTSRILEQLEQDRGEREAPHS